MFSPYPCRFIPGLSHSPQFSLSAQNKQYMNLADDGKLIDVTQEYFAAVSPLLDTYCVSLLVI